MRRLLITALAGIALAGAATSASAATTRVRLDAEPRDAVNAGGHLWVLADRGDTRVLIEAGRLTGRPTGREVVVATGVPVDSGMGVTVVLPTVTAAGDGIWTVDTRNGDAVRIDPATARVTVRAPISARTISAGPSGLWATGQPSFVGAGFRYPLHQLDPVTGAIVREVGFGPGLGRPRALVVGPGGVWVARTPVHSLVRIDTTTGATSTVAIGSWRIAARSGSLISTQRSSCRAWLTPWTGPARELSMCRPRQRMYPRDLTVAGGRLWWAAVTGKGVRRRGVVMQRDLNGGPVFSTQVGRDPVAVVRSGRGVWVMSRSDRTLTRVTP